MSCLSKKHGSDTVVETPTPEMGTRKGNERAESRSRKGREDEQKHDEAGGHKNKECNKMEWSRRR